MPLTPEQRDTDASELKRIGSLMNLSDEQKRKLHDFMSEASEKVQEYQQRHPKASPQDLKRSLLTAAQSFVNVLGFPDPRTAQHMG